MSKVAFAPATSSPFADMFDAKRTLVMLPAPTLDRLTQHARSSAKSSTPPHPSTFPLPQCLVYGSPRTSKTQARDGTAVEHLLFPAVPLGGAGDSSASPVLLHLPCPLSSSTALRLVHFYSSPAPLRPGIIGQCTQTVNVSRRVSYTRPTGTLR